MQRSYGALGFLCKLGFNPDGAEAKFDHFLSHSGFSSVFRPFPKWIQSADIEPVDSVDWVKVCSPALAFGLSAS